MTADALMGAQGVSPVVIRGTMKRLFAHAKQARTRGEQYILDRLSASDYFALDAAWERSVLRFHSDLKSQGTVPLVYVDICGRARWDYSTGIESYSFSLQPLNRFGSFPRGKDEHHIEGNIFSTRDFSRIINELKERSHRPFLVTFEPVAGLNAYQQTDEASKNVVHGILEKRLAEVVEILLPGGFILLGTPIQFMNIADFFRGKGQKEYDSTLRVKALCKKLRCSFEFRPSILGPYWFLRKHRNAK